MRRFTNAVIEAKDEGVLDRDELIRDLLNYLSESEVANFLSNYYAEFYGELAEEEDDYDGQPDEMQEWHDFDPDC
jgi:hypothetical protein